MLNQSISDLILKEIDTNYIKSLKELTMDDIINSNETLDDFLHKNINKEAKIYIYQKDHPFLSKERLEETFGDIFFIQTETPASKIYINTFNIYLFNNKWHYYDESKIKDLIHEYEKIHPDYPSAWSKIIRFGYLKCFYSEEFDPFQETMSRLLNLDDVKSWIKGEGDMLSIFFVRGELMTMV